jgi:signal transduction histidine kinase
MAPVALTSPPTISNMTGPYTYTPTIWPMLISAIFSAALGIYAWRHRHVPGAAPFAVQELFIALWALLTAMEMAATPPVKIVHHKLEGAAAITAMGAMLYFALEYTNPGKWVTRRNVLLLVMGTLGVMLLMATNDLHHLVWTRLWFDRVVHVERGPLNYLLLAWVLLLPTLAVFLFLRLLLRSRGIYRRQALLLLIGAALPVLTFLLEVADIHPLAPLDPVILVWNVSSVLYAVAIFRFRMLEVAPIGRDTAIERMANGVLVLDAEDRIVDLNPAAQQVLALSRGAAFGYPAGQALAAYPDLSRLLEQKTAASIEITLSGTNAPRTFQVQSSPLTHPSGFHLGRLILLQDVTEQRRAQAQILAQQWARAVLQEREQLAHELHDGLSQSLAFVNMQAQSALLHLDGEQLEAARAHLDRLVEVSRELQVDTRELIGNLLAVSLPSEGFCASLRQIVTRYEQQNGLAIHLHIDPSAEALCSPDLLPPAVGVQLVRIAQEALSNVYKHADAPGEIGVQLQIEAGQIHLAITDNGAGFDRDEIGADRGHFGLQVMRQRAALIGGRLLVQSAPGEGTRVGVCVPLER